MLLKPQSVVTTKWQWWRPALEPIACGDAGPFGVAARRRVSSESVLFSTLWRLRIGMRRLRCCRSGDFHAFTTSISYLFGIVSCKHLRCSFANCGSGVFDRRRADRLHFRRTGAEKETAGG